MFLRRLAEYSFAINYLIMQVRLVLVNLDMRQVHILHELLARTFFL